MSHAATCRIAPPALLPRGDSLGSLAHLLLALSLATGTAGGATGCGGERRPAAPDAAQSTSAPPPKTSALAPRVDALVATMRHHVQCNRIMGCAPARALRALGPAAIEAIAAQLRAAPPKDDGWWLVELVRALGELGREARGAGRAAAREALEALLLDPRDELRGRAALALARLAAPESRAPIERALAHWRARGDDPAVVGALLFALERASKPSRGLRREFVALLPASEEQIGRVNAGALAILADVARAWDLPQAAPGLRIVARHRARPARLAAVRALGALRDTGALKLLQDRLGDEIPAIRRAAVRALQEVTGNSAYDTVDEWRAWWGRHEAHRAATRDAGSGPEPSSPDAAAPPLRQGASRGQGASRALDGGGSASPSPRGSGQRGTATRAR